VRPLKTRLRAEHQVIWTRPVDTFAWVRLDILQRLLPFAAVVAGVYAVWRPAWLGLTAGDLRVQLSFGLIAGPLLFVLAAALQAYLTRRRGAIRVSEGGDDALLQGVYYLLNGPLEEGIFRGLLQGGIGALLGAPVGFVVGTAAYVFYHRLGGWFWLDVGATALVGIPFGLAFWLLPGPHSLLGVSIAHVCATCGFIGPGPYLLHKLRLL
jgi:hypothetical protein